MWQKLKTCWSIKKVFSLEVEEKIGMEKQSQDFDIDSWIKQEFHN